MTVFEFYPRFHNENDWSCSSVDKESPWCLSISDCIWHYLDRFYDIPCFVKYCRWPLTKDQFEKPWWKCYCKGFSSYEEYMKSDPKVEYIESQDCMFYSLINTDNTLTFAYQNDEYVFVIHIDSYYWKHPYSEGFGCIINKNTNEIHFVALGEDDGNYWGDHDINNEIITDFDLGIVTSVVNDMSDNLFWDKSELIEKIFNLAKNRNI